MNGAASYAPHHHPGYADSHHHMGPPPGHHYAYPQYTTSMMAAHASSYAPHHVPPPHYAYAPYSASPHHAPPHYTSYPHPPPSHTMTLPQISAPASSAPLPGVPVQEYQQRQPDLTGQVSPPGMGKPKVTATLWEEEGTLCFQVESGGICVARRQDNSMINGTKLLNVAKMTRGRRDGILKSEKNRKVVKIGPMHLKGVWITYERALEFANKEKIAESLYPLFVHNIDDHLHLNSDTSAMTGHGPQSMKDVRAAHAKENNLQVTPSQTAAQQYSMNTPIGSHGRQPTHPATSQSGSARPSLDRAHTYPTPPTNTSSVMGSGPAGSSYEYGAVQSGPQQFVDSKSMPTTPATTPPENAVAPMHHQQYAVIQGYEVSRNHSYSVPPLHQSPYSGAPAGYGYQKTEMGPPTRTMKEGEADQQSGYEPDRAYSYHGHTQAGSESSPRSKRSPNAAAGQSTPHSSGVVTPQTWHPAYTTPKRSQTLPSTRLVYPGGASQFSAAGANGCPTPVHSQGYGYSNGPSSSHKRGRDADDDIETPSDGGHGAKRHRAMREEPRPRPMRR